MRKPVIILTDSERTYLERLVSEENTPLLRKNRAQILLLSAAGETAESLRRILGVKEETVGRTRTRFRNFGVKEAIVPKIGNTTLTTQEIEAILALSRTPPPDGRVRWTIRALSEAVDRSEAFARSISAETIRDVLHTYHCQPWPNRKDPNWHSRPPKRKSP